MILLDSIKEPLKDAKAKRLDKLNGEIVNNKTKLDNKKEEKEPNQTLFKRWKLRAYKMIDERLKTESKKEIVLKFFAAPLLCLIVAIFLYVMLDYTTFSQLGGLMLAYFFPPLGKESIIPIGVSSGEITIPLIDQQIIVQKIDPLMMALSIAFVDIVTAIFLLWNYDFAKLIPYLGPWMDKVERSGGKKFKENTWLEGLAFFGLVLFVMFPFQGSGGVGTSIVGRVIGMNRYKVVIAISSGSIVGCLLIAYLTDLFLEFFRKNFIGGIIIAIIVIILVSIYLIYKSKKKKKMLCKAND